MLRPILLWCCALSLAISLAIKPPGTSFVSAATIEPFVTVLKESQAGKSLLTNYNGMARLALNTMGFVCFAGGALVRPKRKPISPIWHE